MKLNNNIINLALFLGFCILFGIFLLYKYNNKPDEQEKRRKEELKKNYLLSKIKMINEKHQEKIDKMITNLPKFESNFEMLHKNFINLVMTNLTKVFELISYYYKIKNEYTTKYNELKNKKKIKL